MTVPALLDRAQARRHYGLTRVDVERVFERLPVVSLPGLRKRSLALDTYSHVLLGEES